MEDEYPVGGDESPVKMELIPCGTCGRNFAEAVLTKHSKICQNVTSKKRKVFDSAKMRAKGTEIGTVPVKDTGKKIPPSKKSNWRQKHEQFMESMKAAREVSHAIKTGAPLPPPPSQKARINPDYVECPCCNRNFNEGAAERHIPWCKEKNKRMFNKPDTEAKKNKLNVRTQYKPPLPASGGKKKSSPAASRTGYAKRGQDSSPSNGSLEERFNDSVRLNGSGKERKPLTGPKSRSASLERSLSRKSSGPRTRSGDSLKSRIRSEDEYDATDSDEYLNGHGLDTPLRNVRTNQILPHHKLKYESKSSPLITRTPTPPSSRRYSSDSWQSNDSGRRPSKFCYECGTKYPVPHAKYCCECGTKRPFID